MNVILRGVRVIDPAVDRDDAPCDAWLWEGRIEAIERRVERDGVPVIDLTPRSGGDACVLCPAFIDLHCHLREPGDEQSETVKSGARAAAAGGFARVIAMANTKPPLDSPDRVRDAVDRDGPALVTVRTVAALTRGLTGEELVDVEACIRAGAIALSDDGRNAASRDVLAEGLRRAGSLSRPVLVHPEDESYIAHLNRDGDVVRAVHRPAEVEAQAVDTALAALQDADPTGRLHLQHLSTAASVERLQAARDSGMPVTAEVTPHHIAALPEHMQRGRQSAACKVNPPLRAEGDRTAVLDALRQGLIDAVATDHAPHHDEHKSVPYESAAPGMIGLETALAVCLTFGDMGGSWLPVLVERLTVGPHRVLGRRSGLSQPRLALQGPATCVVFDPAQEWTVDETTVRSRSRNTPFLGERLRGRVLITVVDGRPVHVDQERVGTAAQVTHG